jgi:hypothetical protein
MSLSQLAQIAMARGDAASAEKFLEEALEIFKDLGNKEHIESTRKLLEYLRGRTSVDG